MTESIRCARSAKETAGLLVGAGFVAVACFLPPVAGLSHEAVLSLGILMGAVCLWFCGSMATGVVGVLASLLLLVLGVVPSFDAAFSGYVTTTTWFVLAVFCMTALMQQSTLGARLTRRFIRWAGDDTRKLVLAIMTVTALCSSVMTDTGAVALSMSFALPLLETVGAKRGQSNLGRCLLLGISFGALIGGFTTPIGHSLNVLAMGVLQTQTGYVVPFLTWMAYGIPIACLMVPAAWWGLVRVFPPEPIAAGDVEGLRAERFCFGALDRRDWKCLVLLVALPVLWILGNWVPAFAPTTVALVGFVLLFVPGIDIVSWRDFEAMASWNLFLFFGGVLSIGAALTSTGAAAWIAEAFLSSGILSLPALASLLVVAVVLVLLSTVFPIAPSWVVIFLPPLLTYAQAVGLPLVVPTFLSVCLMAGSYLVPLAPALNMTLDTGYYRFGEEARCGWPTQIILVVVAVGWSFFLATALSVV